MLARVTDGSGQAVSDVNMDSAGADASSAEGTTGVGRDVGGVYTGGCLVLRWFSADGKLYSGRDDPPPPPNHNTSVVAFPG